MSKLSRWFILLVLVNVGFACSNSGGTSTTSPVVVFSDVHFDPFYDTTLFPLLVVAESSEWAGIFETSSITEPSTWGNDTNYPLLVLALSSLRQNLGTSPLIINTGDFLSHHFATTFYTLFGSEDPAAMEAFTYKTVAFFVEQTRSYAGDIPVMFVLGNNDDYEGDYKIAPDSPFLADTAELFYTDFLMGTADHQAFLETYTAGGYYVAEPLQTGMVVIGLNTVFLSTEAASDIGNAIETELNWLESTLASARTAGQKVWLLMHVPPGAEIYSTQKLVDGSGQIQTANMLMQSNYQASLLQILSNYSDIITLTLAGHTHMDEYRNMMGGVSSSPEALEITPSISPRSGNDPAFKIFTFQNNAFEPSDYRSLNYDLATLPGEFNSYYTFGAAYSMQGLLDTALMELFPTLATDSAKQTLYRNYYYSGHDASSPITNTNWPVYWCGIGKMVEQELIDCVNTY